MRSRSLWAVDIERMSPYERAKTTRFSPYCVTPEGSLRLPFEDIRREGPEVWPVCRAPGWERKSLDRKEHNIWRPLGSKFYFAKQDEPFIVHVPSKDRFGLDSIDSAELTNLVTSGQAFPFCGRVFVLPTLEKFTMNTMRYHVGNMDDLTVFVGYRGHSKRYEEIITPGLYRKCNNPSEEDQGKWVNHSRIASNILKQRSLEKVDRPLTQLESIGIMQHHQVIERTEMVDFSYDLNVAKWFALNDYDKNNYRQKRFTDQRTGDSNTSCVYTVVARAIPIGVDVEKAKQITPGVDFRLWKDLRHLYPNLSSAVSAWNLAPIWSERPEKQKGFGLIGIGPEEVDEYGSILCVTEHLFHPNSHADGWDCIGGPELVLDGQRFTYDMDSSRMASYLFPKEPKWLKDARREIVETLPGSMSKPGTA